jgi:hypothetical protein
MNNFIDGRTGYNPFKLCAALLVISFSLSVVAIIGVLAIPYGFLARALGADEEYRGLADLLGARILDVAKSTMGWAKKPV